MSSTSVTGVKPIPGKTFQTSYILAINKTVKPQFKKKFQHLLNTLNHENNTKYAQNVHREPWHKQRDGDATDWWLQHQSNGPSFCIQLTVAVLALQDVIKIKRLR